MQVGNKCIVMENEVQKCVELLSNGKVILYPTDTIWGIGCDATNEAAIERIYDIKQRQASKSMIILVDRTDRIPLYVHKIPLIAWDLINKSNRPTTYIYPTGRNLPSQIIHADGSVAIRVVKNPFCRKLIGKLGRPIISTSANISSAPSPTNFKEISDEVISQMDYVVSEQFDNPNNYKASRLIKFLDDYNFIILRD